MVVMQHMIAFLLPVISFVRRLSRWSCLGSGLHQALINLLPGVRVLPRCRRSLVIGDSYPLAPIISPCAKSLLMPRHHSLIYSTQQQRAVIRCTHAILTTTQANVWISTTSKLTSGLLRSYRLLKVPCNRHVTWGSYTYFWLLAKISKV